MSESSEIATKLEARVGTTLAGKYRLGRVLGVGGMGAVFEAVNTWTERRVAIKLLIGARVNDDDVVQRFLREARAASKIEHPNIVDVLDMGQDPEDGTLFIVQEFLVGRDLRTILDDRSVLKPREAFEYLTPIMAALIAAHDHGVVHRDLKPENMFITRNAGAAVPKLIDFGIAKVTARGDRAPSLTRTGETMGTPYYMSPEQARGEKEIDAQTDVWAMGAVWFEALSGRGPFLGDNYNQLLAQILTEPVPSLAGLVPSLPAGLVAVVHRALERDRRVRFTSVRDFLRALLDCADLQTNDWFRALHAQYVPLVGSDGYDNEPTAVVTQADQNAMREAAVASIGAAPAPRPFATTTSRTPRELEARKTTTNPAAVWIGGGVVAAVLVAVTLTFVARGRSHETLARPATTPVATVPAPAPVQATNVPPAPAIVAPQPQPQTTVAPNTRPRVTVRPATRPGTSAAAHPSTTLHPITTLTHPATTTPTVLRPRHAYP